MSIAGAVLACLLSVLGRTESSLPPIVFVDRPPPGVSRHAEGFVRDGEGTIYLVTSAPLFQAAAREERCRNHQAIRKLASVVVHEEWHVRHGADERGAYLAQLTTLQMLNLGPTSAVWRAVRRSMQEVLREQPDGPVPAVFTASGQ